MGRHRTHADGRGRAARSGRVAASAAALGVGVLPMAGVATAAPAAPGPAPASSGAGTVAGTPCTNPAIKACVDLSADHAWLLDGEQHVIDGPVPITHGAEGEETPTGEFVVQWKDRDHVSSEYKGAEMPYSVFFDTHGRAFHAGSLSRDSAGCVHLRRSTAEEFYDHLEPNDQVQIVE